MRIALSRAQAQRIRFNYGHHERWYDVRDFLDGIANRTQNQQQALENVLEGEEKLSMVGAKPPVRLPCRAHAHNSIAGIKL